METLLQNIRFSEPRFLWLLAGIPAFIVAPFLLLLLKKLRVSGSSAFLAELTSAKKWLLKIYLKKFMVLACIFLVGILLMSDLQYLSRVPHFFKEDVAVCWVIDVSASMLAEEAHFGRGGRISGAKKEIREFLSPPFPVGIPMCLIIFAGDVYIIQDLNSNYDVFLQKLDLASPDFFQNQGSNFELAIKSAVDIFPENVKIKRIVILSDGDARESAETDIESAVAYAKEKKVVIDAIGVGYGEAPIPNPRGIGFLKDENRNPKLTILDEETLRDKIAHPTGGIYKNYKNSGELKQHLAEIFEDIKMKATRPIPSWAEADMPLGLLGIFLFFIYLKIHLGFKFKYFFRTRSSAR